MSEKRKSEIATMTRKELNAHALHMESEQEEYAIEVADLRKRVEELEKVEEEHKQLLSLMRRAERLAKAHAEEEYSSRPRFKMDANGNLTRIEDNDEN